MKKDNLSEVDVNEFLDSSNGIAHASDTDVLESDAECEDTAVKPDISGDFHAQLKYEIARFYLNRQLQDAIVRIGKIPCEPVEAPIGVGFVDIVNYSYISSWLSPKENQIFLNGLYTAFHTVLKRNGGYLNKISGDSLMFHFGGNIDPLLRNKKDDMADELIARKLLQTCIEIQQTCRQFNDADENFLEHHDSWNTGKAVKKAFMIISNLRENLALVSSLNAMFQVRIRIGACIGQVCIGNFGPEDARQWDVIGEPVIEARRMEATAPIDGLRISGDLYGELKKCGAADEYYLKFTQSARENKGLYQHLRPEELFLGKTVVLQDKHGVSFESYAVQTNPMLPEIIRDQIAVMLDLDDNGDGIIDLVKYYRGNRHVLNAVEGLFSRLGIQLRKIDLLLKINPRAYRSLLERFSGDREKAAEHVLSRVSLYSLFRVIDKMADIKRMHIEESKSEDIPFTDYDSYAKKCEMSLMLNFQQHQKEQPRYMYIMSFLLPFLLGHIRASILEYKVVRGEKKSD